MSTSDNNILHDQNSLYFRTCGFAACNNALINDKHAFILEYTKISMLTVYNLGCSVKLPDIILLLEMKLNFNYLL